jgi:hypothetical protein
MVKGESNEFDTNYSNPSTILTTKYGYEAMKLIHLIGKNLYMIISFLALITILSIANTVGFHYIFAYDGSIDFIVDISLSIILIIILIPLVRLFIKSKKVLDNWTDMFERSTLSTSLNLALTNRDKKSAIMAVAQSVDPVGDLFQDYININNSKLDEFVDVAIGNDFKFDVLMDSEHVLNSIDNKNNDNEKDLGKVLHDYGAICIEILDNIIDEKSIEYFIEKMSRYTKITDNPVSLGIIIGESVSQEAKTFVENYMNKKRKSIHLLILIEKQLVSPPQSNSSQSTYSI